MSEPIERLSRFTPAAGGLDRDRLLFEAGRASARPSRSWRMLCVALAASQALTLAALGWPRPDVLPSPDRPTAPLANQPAPPAPAADEPSLWRLRDQALASDRGLPAPRSVADLVADEPPLHAFGALPTALLE